MREEKSEEQKALEELFQKLERIAKSLEVIADNTKSIADLLWKES